QKQQVPPNTVGAEISSFGTAPPSNPSSNDPVDLNAQPLPSTLSPTASSFSVPSPPSPTPPPLPRDASDQLPQASPTATVSPYPINIDPTPTIKINPQQPSGNLPVNDNTAGSLSATDAAMLRRHSDVPNDVGHMASISTDHLWPSSDEVNSSQEPLQGKSGDGEKQSESHGEALPNQLGATVRHPEISSYV
ncbi:unnamed protein product, partial [Anisakis simplex]|uniref:Protein tyrosine phosphatase non-receptor type 12 n=1 Tax=Anisakis simplex TaxID=6269 RepID=A0A0M3JY97_ANISI